MVQGNVREEIKLHNSLGVSKIYVLTISVALLKVEIRSITLSK